MDQQRLPFLPLYATRWLYDQHFLELSVEAQGVLFRAMLHCWIDGTVSSDPGILARLCGSPTVETVEAATELFAYWLVPVKGNVARAYMPALEDLRAQQIEKRQSYATRGKAGMESRWRGRPRTEEDGDTSPAPDAQYAHSGRTVGAQCAEKPPPSPPENSSAIAQEKLSQHTATTDLKMLRSVEEERIQIQASVSIRSDAPTPSGSTQAPASVPVPKGAEYPKSQLAERRDSKDMQKLWTKLPAKYRTVRFAAVVEVYDGWLNDPWYCGQPAMACLTEKRFKKIHDRLERYTVQQLLRCFTGAKNDPWYQDNPQYRDPVTIFRDDDQVQKFNRLVEEVPNEQRGQQQHGKSGGRSRVPSAFARAGLEDLVDEG